MPTLIAWFKTIKIILAEQSEDILKIVKFYRIMNYVFIYYTMYNNIILNLYNYFASSYVFLYENCITKN